jgi:DNA-binding response OmpR family regulator
MEMASRKILVVDDETELLLGTVIRLKAAGFDVLTAADGLEGLEKARKDSPDLIVLDLMLPKMEGLEVCGTLKRDEKYKNIPIIMLTAKAQDIDRRRGAEVGADAYITKPCDHILLLEKIEELLKNKQDFNEDVSS